ncbi:MAG: SDR family oxidoreductase [Novosphingobium sp.]|nr:SDR family oxidoreductase [Novosphingobium sp.]
MRLTDRTAFITGSSRGIGAAIARRLAADGAAVVLHASRSADRVEQLAEEIRANGGKADFVLGDVTEGETSAQLVRDAFAVHGALDILVCNAGGGLLGPLESLGSEQIDAILALNLRSVILATAEFARLTQSAHGRVVLVSSAAAVHPAAGATIYSAAKGGADAFIRSAAQELGPRGITLNSVQPGMTVTEMLSDQNWIDTVSGWTAMGRVGEPQDIADVVAFLASDEARWLTGTVIPASGGQITSATNIIARM